MILTRNPDIGRSIFEWGNSLFPICIILDKGVTREIRFGQTKRGYLFTLISADSSDPYICDNLGSAAVKWGTFGARHGCAAMSTNEKFPAGRKPFAAVFGALGDSYRQRILLFFEPGDD
jgi:hypothetical protein